ncbi:unnamed protein product [Diabrotica balteata]|uniref:E3 ubiquitin-protein ligase PPP1R11 n=1 Tax=Diabrotica balteata TaxID=107213 RepID=A0A9N9T5G4_DIABA|nr:unnamed protein product [Diabrotica balteata]
MSLLINKYAEAFARSACNDGFKIWLFTHSRAEEVPRVRLKLRKPRTDRKVQWSTETVDNENMNKKKSKCCCIYDKPKKFGESSSDEDEDECDHCHGHVEKKKHKQHPTAGNSIDSEGGLSPGDGPSS